MYTGSNENRASSFLQEVTNKLVIDRSAFTIVEETKQSNDECDEEEQSCSETQIEGYDDENEGDREDKARSNFFVWGNNSCGQLTLGEETQTIADPIAIRLPNSIKKIKSVACGGSHTLILSQNGFVFAMGDNSFGQLGLSPIQKGYSNQPLMVPNLV